jgi:Tfp pilus assembly protein PilN
MVAMSQSAPQGTQLESLSMTRQGEVGIQGKASSFEAANEFRAKLARSGWFGQIVIQDQAPSKEQGKVEFRMNARLKPGAAPVPVQVVSSPSPAPGAAASSGASVGAAAGAQPAPAPPPEKGRP